MTGVKSCFLHGSPEHLAQEEQQEMFINVSRREQSNKQSGFGREFPLLSPTKNKKGKEDFSQYSFGSSMINIHSELVRKEEMKQRKGGAVRA